MIILHGSVGSPFSARVRMQTFAKDIPVEVRAAAPGTPEWKRMNPIGKVPVLEHDGLLVPESAVILEYIEETFPTPPLLGDNPKDRMLARLIVRTLDLYCGGVLELLRSFMDPSHKIDVEAKRAEMNKGLDALEAFLADDGFAVGGKLSIADCALAPWIFYARGLTERGDDALTSRPKLSRYIQFISEMDVTKRLWAEMDEAYRGFMARFQAEQAKANQEELEQARAEEEGMGSAVPT